MIRTIRRYADTHMLSGFRYGLCCPPPLECPVLFEWPLKWKLGILNRLYMNWSSQKHFDTCWISPSTSSSSLQKWNSTKLDIGKNCSQNVFQCKMVSFTNHFKIKEAKSTKMLFCFTNTDSKICMNNLRLKLSAGHWIFGTLVKAILTAFFGNPVIKTFI